MNSVLRSPLPRRAFVATFAASGLGSTLFPGALWAELARGAELTVETIACAEEIAGLELEADQRQTILEELIDQREQITGLREIPLPNSVPPAIVFNPLLPGMAVRPSSGAGGEMVRSEPPRTFPASDDEIAFAPVAVLSRMIRAGSISSERLTRLYLERMRRYDPVLHAVVTLTEDRALAKAREMDAEIAAGKYRGPLHGIPWGAKDLLAVEGYPTTWGVSFYREQMLDGDATVVERLDRAGAVLVAKLSLGELAWGDVWFGGKTRNPWNPEQGSSGSSAGPGSAVAAGLAGFAIGSETLGSISSPATRNGVTGLRPTFGRVPRTGAMALSWTMDKLGPMCRSAEDCALVFDAIHGADGVDLSVHSAAFRWDASLALRDLKVGYFRDAFERDSEQYSSKPFDLATLDVLRSLGADLRPVAVPELDYGAMRLILSAEAAAAFDDITRSGRINEMVRQGENTWPATFRAARFIPAVEYINANRVRTLAMQRWAELFDGLDAIVTPTSAPNQLVATNLTGHPALILPNGFREDGTPVSITMLGPLFGEAKILALGHAYQQATDFHLRHPPAMMAGG